MRLQTERLTEEQILKLLGHYRETGDEEAREKLVRQYSNLVESIGRRFAGSGEPVEDMVQEGYLGLISALEGFNTDKGVKFSTYATHFIIGQIKHYLRDKGKIIKEPAWLQEVNQRMTKVIEQLSQQLGRQPHEAEIASVMKMPEEDVRDMLSTREVFKVSSLDGEREDPGSAQGEAEQARKQKYESAQMPMEEKIVLENAVTRLKEIEQRVIHEYYFQDLNQTEIAKKLNISCNYVSHILRNSTRKLKKILTTEEIKEVQTQLRAMQRRGVTEDETIILDPVTDLYTRSYFLARLEEELTRSARHSYPVAVMLITLEYHCDRTGEWMPLTTDERLTMLAGKVRKNVRRADIVSRYSDNQFALILPHTGSMASRVCERLSAMVEKLNVDSGREMFHVRATLNHCCYPEEVGNFADILSLLDNWTPGCQSGSATSSRKEEMPLAA